MNVFNEEPIQRTVKEVDSWPIKLAMKYGAKTEQQATTIVIVLSIILLFTTIILYTQIFSNPNPAGSLEELTLEQMKQIEATGLKI